MSLHILAASDLSAECALDYPEACNDPGCLGYDHMPDRGDDTVWTSELDDLSWLEFDRRAERRADR